MQPEYRIPSGADELRGLSPTEWFSLKDRIVRDARLDQAAVIRAAFAHAPAATAHCVRSVGVLARTAFATAVRTHKAIHH